MADLAKSAVEITDSGYLGGIGGRRYRSREVILTLTAQGTAANKILASVLSLTKVVGSSSFVKDDNTDIVVGAPSYSGAQLLLKAAATNAPADYTGTFRGTVWGT